MYLTKLTLDVENLNVCLAIVLFSEVVKFREYTSKKTV